MRQGTNALEALDRLKSGLGVRDNAELAESSQSQNLLTTKMDRHKFSMGIGVESLKVYAKGVAHCARSYKQNCYGATPNAIH